MECQIVDEELQKKINIFSKKWKKIKTEKKKRQLDIYERFNELKMNPSENISRLVLSSKKEIYEKDLPFVKRLIPILLDIKDGKIEGPINHKFINDFVLKGVEHPIDLFFIISILYYYKRIGKYIIFQPYLRSLTYQYYFRFEETRHKFKKFVIITPGDGIVVNLKVTPCTLLLMKLRYNKIILFLFKNEIVTKIQSIVRSFLVRKKYFFLKNHISNALEMWEWKPNINVSMSNIRKLRKISKAIDTICLFIYKYKKTMVQQKTIDIYIDDINDNKFNCSYLLDDTRHLANRLINFDYKEDCLTKLELLNYLWNHNISSYCKTIHLDLILWYCILYAKKNWKNKTIEWTREYSLKYYLYTEWLYINSNKSFTLPEMTEFIYDTNIKSYSLKKDSNYSKKQKNVKIKNILKRFEKIYDTEIFYMTKSYAKNFMINNTMNTIDKDTNSINTKNDRDLINDYCQIIINNQNKKTQKKIQNEKRKKEYDLIHIINKINNNDIDKSQKIIPIDELLKKEEYAEKLLKEISNNHKKEKKAKEKLIKEKKAQEKLIKEKRKQEYQNKLEEQRKKRLFKKKRNLLRRNSAIIIQKLYRSHLAHIKQKEKDLRWKEKKRKRKIRKKKNLSAIFIQKIARSFLAKNIFDKKRKQESIKRLILKYNFKNVLNKIVLNDLYNNSAIRIQSYYRMYSNKYKYQNNKFKIIKNLENKIKSLERQITVIQMDKSQNESDNISLNSDSTDSYDNAEYIENNICSSNFNCVSPSGSPKFGSPLNWIPPFPGWQWGMPLPPNYPPPPPQFGPPQFGPPQFGPPQFGPPYPYVQPNYNEPYYNWKCIYSKKDDSLYYINNITGKKLENRPDVHYEMMIERVE